MDNQTDFKPWMFLFLAICLFIILGNFVLTTTNKPIKIPFFDQNPTQNQEAQKKADNELESTLDLTKPYKSGEIVIPKQNLNEIENISPPKQNMIEIEGIYDNNAGAFKIKSIIPIQTSSPLNDAVMPQNIVDQLTNYLKFEMVINGKLIYYAIIPLTKTSSSSTDIYVILPYYKEFKLNIYDKSKLLISQDENL